MPSVLYKGWNYKVMYVQIRKKGANYITNLSGTTKELTNRNLKLKIILTGLVTSNIQSNLH